MRRISSKEKAIVRKYAQKLKPTFQIGAAGFHEEVSDAIREGFNNKEVLKVKVNREDKFDKEIVKEIATKLEKMIPCQVAGVIGTTIIIYKENEKIEEDDRLLKV